MTEIGARIDGRFTIVLKIGQGTFGEVFLAHDTANEGSWVALKLLRPIEKENLAAKLLDRFEREIRVLAELSHPGIARAIAGNASSDPPYLALEFVQGSALNVLLARRSAAGALLERREIEELFGGLLQAAAFAHARGIVHRDLKPKNVMVIDKLGRLETKILDFGIAKVLEDDGAEATTVGRMLGSVAYLAPEQIDSKSVDARADVFALGTILFELLTLRRGWIRDADGLPLSFANMGSKQEAQNSRVEILGRILRSDRPRPSRWRPGLPDSFDAVVARALEPGPEDRYQSVADLERDFMDAIGQLDAQRTAVVVGDVPTQSGDLSAFADTADDSNNPSTMVMPVPMDEGASPDPSFGSALTPTSPPRRVGRSPRAGRPPAQNHRPWAVSVVAGALGALTVSALLWLRPEPDAVSIPVPTEEQPKPAAPAVEAIAHPDQLESAAAPEPPSAAREASPTSPPRRIESRARREVPARQESAAPRPRDEDAEVAAILRAIERAKKDPGNTKLVSQVFEELERALGRARDETRRVGLRRCASMGTISSEPLDDLPRCLDRLLTAR